MKMIKNLKWTKGLMSLNIAILLSAILGMYFRYTNNIEMTYIFKPLTTVLIILVPIIYGKREVSKYFYSIVVALFFCLAGDVFLMYENYFIHGLASFLIGHILFFYAFISLGGMKYLVSPLVALLLLGLSVYTFIFNNLDDLLIPVSVYMMFIILMSWQGVSLYLWKKKQVFLGIAIAVVLFLISDSMIAIGKFKYPIEILGILILLTYWASILIIANSTFYIQKEENSDR